MWNGHGTVLGKFGINLGQFVQQFNDRTKEYNGTPIPVIVSVYNDRSFEFVTKSPPAASLLKKIENDLGGRIGNMLFSTYVTSRVQHISIVKLSACKS